MRRTSTGAIAAAALVAAAAPAHAAPAIDQLVVFKNGSAKQKHVSTAKTKARVGGKRCAIGAATPMAALVRSRVGKLKFHDYGSCSKRPADAAALYVRSIAGERAKGANGWVYKLGNKVGTAGAADPAGPFGRGLLNPGDRITWFYCHMSPRTASCQRTLAVKPGAQGGGAVKVIVRAYDDRGRGHRVKGATVHAGSASAKTGRDGTATLPLDPGRARVYASRKGLVRSFEEAVDVK